MNTVSPSLLVPGAVIAGKYKVERLLGEGGMGVVVAAHHTALDQRVALKILRLGAAERPEIVERFVREARSAARLRTEHVARVLDVATLDSGLPYIVLEYLEGSDLDAWVRKNGPMPCERAVTLILQACEAVAEAHALGIVHRDIKPHNLFLTQGIGGSDLLKVLDFGVAKSTGFAGGVLTQSDSSVGSPLYMSPEQMRSSRDVDARTDIWSLGVTLYEIIAGRPPFDAESFPELVLKVQAGHIVPLSVVRPDVPPLLSDVVARALQGDRDQRYPHVAAFASALEAFAGHEGRLLAENARRALGLAPSGHAIPVSSAMPPSASTSIMPASSPPPSAAASATPAASAHVGGGPAARRPVVSTGSQGGAWSESVATAAPPGASKRAPLVALGAGVLVVGALGAVFVLRPRPTQDEKGPVAPALASVTAPASGAPSSSALPAALALAPGPVASAASAASVAAPRVIDAGAKPIGTPPRPLAASVPPAPRPSASAPSARRPPVDDIPSER